MADLYYDFVFGTLASSSAVGDTVVSLDDVSSFPSNTVLAKGDFWVTLDSSLTHPNSFESVKVTAVDTTAKTLTVSPALSQPHSIGTTAKGSITAGVLGRLRAGLTGTTVPSGTDSDLYRIGDRFFEQSTGLTYIYGASGFKALSVDRMRYLGAWQSGGSYVPNDVVSYNSKLYVANSAVSNTPTVIGASGLRSLSSAAHIVLPTGTLAGDLALVAVSAESSVTSVPGFTYLFQAGPSTVYLSAFAYMVSSTDVTNGYISWSATQPYASLEMLVVRNATMPSSSNLAASAASSTTVPAFTPTSSGLAVAMWRALQTTKSLTGLTVGGGYTLDGYSIGSDNGETAIIAHQPCVSGTALPSSTATANPVWTGTGGGSQYADAAVLVVQGAAGFPAGSFTEIAAIHDSNGRLQSADPAVSGDVATKNYADTKLNYRGDWAISTDYAVNDLVRFNGKLYRYTSAFPASGTTVVGGAKVVYSANAGTIPIPTGAQSGDLLLIFFSGYGASDPIIAASVTTLVRRNLAGETQLALIYSYTLTAADVAAGSLSFTGGPNVNAWASFAIRSATGIDSATTYPGTHTDVFPTFTPASSGGAYLFRAAMVGLNGGSTSSSNISIPGVSGYLEDLPPNTGYTAALGAGYLSVGAGATATSVTATVLHSFYQDWCLQVGVGAMLATAPPPASTVVVATYDNPAVSNLDTVSASGAAQTITDVSTATMHRITLTAACTLTFPTPVAGKRFRLALTQDSTGGRTAAWPAAVKWPSATAPTLSTAANATDVFEFECYDGTNWLGRTLGLSF
jgi:hypothetical protein